MVNRAGVRTFTGQGSSGYGYRWKGREKGRGDLHVPRTFYYCSTEPPHWAYDRPGNLR